MSKLSIVVVSTRPGRAGLPIGTWFHERAKAHGKFEVELVDLKEVNLPLLDEPKHPRFGQYEHEHTKAWSARVKTADAFVFVTPEYNYSAPAPLVNAVDYLFTEWNYKPCAFVSYGGLSGGTRSVQVAKGLVTSVRMMPLPEAVNVPFFQQHLKDGVFTPPETVEKSVTPMLDELKKWSDALATMRK